MIDILLNILKPSVLFPWLLSMAFGIFVGGMPGLTATMAVALIIPISYYMEPLAGLAMVIGASFTAIFAGDIPATFLRIPGTPASGAATLDGYEMNKKGMGDIAISLDLVCSALGGIIGVLILIFVSPPLAKFALKFSHFEYFWLGLFGLSMSAVISKGNTIKGLISAALGLLISTIGMDITTGYPRFAFGNPELYNGVSFIPAMIGLFGISEVLKYLQNSEKLQIPDTITKIKASISKVLSIVFKKIWSVISSAFVGTVIGALPGAGADIAAWVSYGVAKKTSKNRDNFGKGEIDGVIAPTSANNAALGGTWIPALVFGLPGDSITAIVLGAMLMYGLRPGPLIFQENGDLLKQMFTIAIVTQLLLLIVGYIGIKLYSLVMKMPKNILMVYVTAFSIVGAYAIRNSLFDVLLVAIFGVIGYLMETIKMPLAPMILGIILGPMVEESFRVGLIKTEGNFLPFLERPISLALFIIIVFTFLSDPIFKFIRKLVNRKV